MNDFWLSCGHHLLDRDEGGGLRVTNEFLKAYLARPELNPPANACVAERTLHAAVLSEPRRPVDAKEIAAIANADARENWQVMVAFRDHLIRHKTVEAAYLALVRQDVDRTPPMFINQLVHVILRNVLDGCGDAFMVRAAELFFRAQRLTIHEGSLIAADEEIVESNRRAASPLGSMRGPMRGPMRGLPDPAGIEVLNDENAAGYWQRSDQFDMALDLTAGGIGLAALGVAIGRWVGHLLAVAVDVDVVIETKDVNLAWYVGLDAEATRIGDALWNGEELEAGARDRIIGLFRLTFRDPEVALDKAKGEPIYLLLAMTPDRTLRMQPQNLITGLPIRNRETVP